MYTKLNRKMFDQIYISQVGDLFMSVLYYIFDVETEDICLLGAGYERFSYENQTQNSNEAFKVY